MWMEVRMWRRIVMASLFGIGMGSACDCGEAPANADGGEGEG
jgi:hypothetical protein